MGSFSAYHFNHIGQWLRKELLQGRFGSETIRGPQKRRPTQSVQHEVKICRNFRPGAAGKYR